ncbi:hypothetical protein O181_076917 [Austropuccinia psidii MF-1]|uniref:Uncharacterized protein n=1 Tax=Austropuccinia psidii MF-1 TaxID=1389203 RepID=A0A9Q3FF61_9BASI|nr:hypothetical protein [Austropuccinia psidii MF-1]
MLTRPHPPPDETPTLPPHLLLGLPFLHSGRALKSCLQCGPHPAYHPYAHGVPSRHASDTAYHPYAGIVPAQQASNTSYHPYACSALPTCLQHPLTLAQSSRPLMILTLLQPPQDETTMLPPALSSLPLTILTLPLPLRICL